MVLQVTMTRSTKLNIGSFYGENGFQTYSSVVVVIDILSYPVV